MTFRFSIVAVLEISAPPDVVYGVLTGAGEWGAWSTMLVFLGGQITKGERVRLGLRTAEASYDFNATVTELQPGTTFEWLARTGLPGLFDGRHRFELTPVGAGRTRLRNVETYTGLFVPIIRRLAMMRSAPEGFRRMNAEIATRAAAITRVSP